ncbi:FtsX-like permease family protein [Tissierella sp. Yu-01]|uniref:FtsX-like permease family protein n=1 Tax=Tissierella sp. Yu-01 TaxID=3035694 RepID=UPI00240D99B3|nr:FtsX-like permease family protein [Tissierella sp. Yu-01]WFA08637.1 FtsX-like permease family protein [Tissierella sp. Yu-01]
MGIILKYILNSIFEKKFRTFIIVFSVTLSAGLFFASNGMSVTMKNMYEALFRMQTGKADILIYPDSQSPSNSFMLKTEPVEGVKFIAGEVIASGRYHLPKKDALISKIKWKNLTIRGFDMAELEELNPVSFSQYAVNRPFEGNHIIISSLFADDYGFKVGDSIDLEINGQNRKVTVWGIGKPTGIFKHTPQSNTINALMPQDTLASLLDIKGRVQVGYVVLEEGVDKQSVEDQLGKQYTRYTVQRPFSEDELNTFTQFIVVPLFMMTTMVLFISIFIIYSTFKVITVERLPVIGTFRSIGATRKMTDTILIGESLTYGIIGGIFGNLVGIGFLYVIANVMAADPYSGGQLDVAIDISIGNLLMSFILAVGVALISSWIPIKRASKIPIKDLVLNTTEPKSRKDKQRLVIGISLFGLGFILPRIVPNSLAFVINIFSILASTVSLIMFVPFLTKAFLKVFERIYVLVFGNEGILAVKNINGNKNILNNISLLTIGISTILMINTISDSVGIEVLNAYKDWKFDIMFFLDEADRNTEQVLRGVDGVSSTYGAYESWAGVNVVDTHYTINYLQGIDIKRYRDYVDFHFDGDDDVDEAFQMLDEGRNIMVTLMIRDELNLSLGEEIILEMESGDKTYTVIGFFDSIMSNGSNAIISQKYYKTDMKQPYFGSFYIRTSKNPDEVLLSIQEKFMRRGASGDTIANMTKMNYDSNNQFMIILQAFSILAMLIGIFGVFNNYTISFIERQRSIAILRSVGLSKKQTIKMVMIEALTGGLIGGIIGIIGGLQMLSGIPYLVKAMVMPLKIHYTGIFFINSLIGGIIIATLASISPAIKTSRQNIVEAIKYE